MEEFILKIPYSFNSINSEGIMSYIEAADLLISRGKEFKMEYIGFGNYNIHIKATGSEIEELNLLAFI